MVHDLCFCTGDGETLQKEETEHKIKFPSVVLSMLHFYLKHVVLLNESEVHYKTTVCRTSIPYVVFWDIWELIRVTAGTPCLLSGHTSESDDGRELQTFQNLKVYLSWDLNNPC